MTRLDLRRLSLVDLNCISLFSSEGAMTQELLDDYDDMTA